METCKVVFWVAPIFISFKPRHICFYKFIYFLYRNRSISRVGLPYAYVEVMLLGVSV